MSQRQYPQRVAEDVVEDDDDERIRTFLEEEGVPVGSGVSMEDIASALLTLGLTVATASTRFAAKIAAQRLDCLSAVEGELLRDAEKGKMQRHGATKTAAQTTASPTPPLRASYVGVRGWIHHIYEQEDGVSSFLQGGKAEFGFTLATYAEEMILVVAVRSVAQRLAPLVGNNDHHAGHSSPTGWWSVLWRTVAPMVVLTFASWPLRAARTAIRVNYMADTPPPAPSPSISEPPPSAQRQPRQRRYKSVTEVWRRVLACVGVRGLLLNGLDVDIASRLVSLGLAWTVVQPASRWMRQVALLKRVDVTSSTPVAAAASSSLFVRLGQGRLFSLLVLMAVTGFVNVVQRPFVVLRLRMALLPRAASERWKMDDGAVVEEHPAVPASAAVKSLDEKNETPQSRQVASPRHHHRCRYANGLDGAVQMWRSEGFTSFFAGLPLCLLTSTTVPLLLTFAGYPTAPSFSGAAY